MSAHLDLVRLGSLTRVGSGGQGVVFAAPGLRMQYASSLVFKQYKPDVARALDAAVLESMPAYLESLPFAQGMELLSQAAWPCRLVDDRGAVAGFVMPAIPDAFFVQMRKSSGMSREAAEMQHLLNDDSFLARRQLAVSDRRRYELLGETARALSVFHRHGIAVGDLSPKNLLYARQAPGVYFIDCDAMRFRGRSVMPQLETPGWEVRAVSPREELGTAASDSYKLGLLALRLLAGSQDARDPARLPRAVPAAVRRLVEAALSPDPARRPAPGQWITPLNTAAATASAAAPQAPPRAAPVTTTVAPGFVPGGLAYPRTGQPATGQWPAGTAPSPAPYRPVTRRRGRFTAKTIAWTSGIAAVLIAAIAIVANNGGNSPTSTSALQGATVGAATADGPAVPQSGEPSTRTALPTHYTSRITGFTPAATLSGKWGDGSSWADSSTVGIARFANDELTFSYTARHSGEDSALTEGTGGACVSVNDDGVTFNEAPMTASPSIDATYPDDFSGSITVAAFMPGTYTLTWDCNDSLYTSESLPLGTLKGTSIRHPQVDDMYGSWIWFVTAVDYTSTTTTVYLATISENGVLQEGGKIWHLADENGNSIASAQSKVTNVAGQANQVFGGSSKVVYLAIKFPIGKHGLKLYCADELNPGLNDTDRLP